MRVYISACICTVFLKKKPSIANLFVMLPEGLANNHKGYPLYAFGEKMLCLM
jgi:hypothetical protein